MHSFGKAIGATGGMCTGHPPIFPPEIYAHNCWWYGIAIILGNETIRNTLANFAKSVIFTTSPSFPFVAAIKTGYTLLETNELLQVCLTQAWMFMDHTKILTVV